MVTFREYLVESAKKAEKEESEADCFKKSDDKQKYIEPQVTKKQEDK